MDSLVSLSKEDRISLLKDILNNHNEDCCASKSEYLQATRLATSLQVEFGDDIDTKDILHQINSYCQKGHKCKDHNSHITEFSTDLTGWVEHLETIEKK